MNMIRIAVPADAPRLALLQEQTFRATFGAGNTAQDMALHCTTHYSAALQAQEILDPHLVTLVCDESGVLSGFAQMKRGPAPDCMTADQPVEIQRLYVDQAWHGKGLAQQLMEQCLQHARRLGARHIWLGVWENNPRAIRYYQKSGFTEVGAHIFMVGSDAQRDVIMQRAV